jgi:hypothetical protein
MSYFRVNKVKNQVCQGSNKFFILKTDLCSLTLNGRQKLYGNVLRVYKRLATLRLSNWLSKNRAVSERIQYALGSKQNQCLEVLKKTKINSNELFITNLFSKEIRDKDIIFPFDNLWRTYSTAIYFMKLKFFIYITKTQPILYFG